MAQTRRDRSARGYEPAYRVPLRYLLGGTAICIGGVILIVASYLPWYLEASNNVCVAYEQTGMENGWGSITLGFGIAALAFGGLLLGGIRPRLISVISLALFVAIGLLVLFAWWTRYVSLWCPVPDAGSGIYVAWAAIAAGLAGSIPGLSRRRHDP